MNAEQELFGLYEQWHALTLEEGEALHSGNWWQVAECQQAKRLLQDKVAAASEHLKTEATPDQLAGVEGALRERVAELIQLERNNSEILARQKRTREAERAELGRANQNLRTVGRAYQTSSGAGWESYS
jgi:hypothetical protein